MIASENTRLGFFSTSTIFVSDRSAQNLKRIGLAPFRKKKPRQTHFMSANDGSTETTYNYDANGNRSGGSYDVGDGNRLAADATWNYFYDNEGNLIKRVNITEGEDAGITWTYAYDNANHLIQAKEWDSDPDVNEDATLLLQANYTYDVFGNRIEKSVDWDGAGEDDPVITKFAYDGWNNVKSSSPVGNENWDVWADLEDNGSLATRYVRGDVVDQLFARVANNGDTLWNLTDQQGSVRDVIDNSGAVLDTITYDAFGNFTESDPEFGGRYKWTSREFDAETGFQFNRARYYDAETGRWISQDPLGFDAGDSNLYRYVNNRPTQWTDPSGKVNLPLPNGFTWLGAFSSPTTRYGAAKNNVGMIIADHRGSLQKGTAAAEETYIALYHGLGAKQVRWIQYYSISLRAIVLEDKKLVERILPANFTLPFVAGAVRKTSDSTTRNLYLDRIPPSIYYHAPEQKVTGYGGVSDFVSWISDTPPAPREYAKHEDVIEHFGTTAAANKWRLVGTVVRVDFYSIAVAMDKKGGSYLGNVHWDSNYGTKAAVEPPANSILPYPLDANTHWFMAPNAINGALPAGDIARLAALGVTINF